jgi:hypothetical protein
LVHVERRFRLAVEPNLGVCCDEGGLFVGGAPLFVRAISPDGDRVWRPLSVAEINEALGKVYGLPIDVEGKVGGLAEVARALDRGDLARAQILTLHLQLPDPLDLSKSSGTPRQLGDLVVRLKTSGLLKSDWDPAKHPRWPASSPDSVGGQFAPVGADGGGTPAAPESSSHLVARFKYGLPKFVTHTDRINAELSDGVHRHPADGPGDVSEFDVVNGLFGPPSLPHFKPDPIGDIAEIAAHAADMRSIGAAGEKAAKTAILESGYTILGEQVPVRDQFGQLRIIDFLIGLKGDSLAYAAIEVKANGGRRNTRQRTIDHNLEILGGTIVSHTILPNEFKYGTKIYPHTTVLEVDVAHP